ncbi:MAG TPA: wax ester/triacylglycerol synthase family O-acyltransferase [Nocardioides sp.]|nr:wax ester/triacylglycerol synthase family O-acyltransferase [Nocardioides sp.]
MGKSTDTMSALDSAFLRIEDRHTALHIGSVGIFDGPVPPFADVRAEIESKLVRVPRYRQRMFEVPADLGRPVWRDDPEFDLDYHLRHTALPAPGGDAELQDLVGRVMSRPLDHDRPLWEDWVVEGLADGQWALITKVHHSMVDGIAGTDLLTTLFGRDVEPAPPHDAAEPSRRGGLPAGLDLLRHPRRLADTAVASTAGLLRFLTAARPVSRTSLLGPLGAARRYRWAVVPLADVLAIRSSYGCTVNDVVLAAVTIGFRDLLVARDEEPAPHAVRTLVPVSVRRPEQHGALDNRVSAILLDLPVDEPDPVLVLAIVAQRMRDLKRSHEAEAGELVTALGNDVPPPALAAALRLVFRVPQQFITTVTTNVPGPREELSLCGRPMVAAYPYVPIADRVRTGIAVTSYGGNLYFGITADWQSTPDIDVLRESLLAAFAELARHNPRHDPVEGAVR